MEDAQTQLPSSLWSTPAHSEASAEASKSPLFLGLDESSSVIGSRQATPLSGFIPLTREATPLHADFSRLRSPPVVSLALQHFAKQIGEGRMNPAEAEPLDAGARLGIGGGGDADLSRRSGGSFPIFAAEKSPATLGRVSEDAPIEVCRVISDGAEQRDGSTPLPVSLRVEELLPAPSLVGSMEDAGGKRFPGGDDFSTGFLGTPECTPLHLGILSAPPGGGQHLSWLGAGSHMREVWNSGIEEPFVADDSQDLPSAGSAGHPLLCAKPCKYACKPRGCKDGKSCDRCHLCPWRRMDERQQPCQRGARTVMQ
uniref:C3H1-type domain-containing protein n=1 Tax=Alexandrium monilatum TaxID=311494 RepID=A0A7S4RBE8_9DINO|mmetsp:Transcript_82680/g.246571  ORF Transcript_82680/g.246571 Transcript_82680/m.246571 type:complete len:312 (-) Transcript_82680:6-941(-)